MTDRELWTMVTGGNEDCFKQLFNRYYSEAVSTAMIYVGQEAIAKDMAQELFCRLWMKRQEIVIQKGVRVYIKSAIRNACLNHLKKNKRTVTLEEGMEMEDQSPDSLDFLKTKDLIKAVNDAIEKMPAACRTIFLLRRIEGLSVKEVAKQLDISPKTVENQITKAGKILTKLLLNHLHIWLLILFFICSLMGVLPNNNVF